MKKNQNYCELLRASCVPCIRKSLTSDGGFFSACWVRRGQFETSSPGNECTATGASMNNGERNNKADVYGSAANGAQNAGKLPTVRTVRYSGSYLQYFGRRICLFTWKIRGFPSEALTSLLPPCLHRAREEQQLLFFYLLSQHRHVSPNEYRPNRQT